jgi:hypothetical protein
MSLTIQQLIDYVMAITRFLTLIDGDSARLGLGIIETLSETVRPPSQWVCVRWRGETCYALKKEGGGGLYQRYLPEGVDREKIPTIEPDANALDRLIEQVKQMLEALIAGQPVRIGDTGETLDLIAEGDAQQHLRNLRDYVANAEAAITPGYNQRVISTMATELQAGAAAPLQDTTPAENRIDRMIEKLQKVAYSIGLLRQALAADATLASWFLIYRDLCLKAERRLRDLHQERQAEKHFVTYYMYGCLADASEPLDLIGQLIRKMDSLGLSGVVVEVADSHLVNGEKHIRLARDCPSVDTFAGHLYTAGLYLFAALMAYKVLVSDAEHGVSIEKSDLCRRSLTVADEKLARLTSSFAHAVENRNGESLLRDRAKVAAVLATDGPAAAEQVVFELIEMHLLYPRFFKEVLLAKGS